MIKNLFSMITPTQQAANGNAPAQEASTSQKGVFGALMQALSSSESEATTVVAENGELQVEQVVQNTNEFTVVVDKISSKTEQGEEIENKQVVDSANVEEEPTFAPLVQNADEVSETSDSDIEGQEEIILAKEKGAEKETAALIDEEVATAIISADKPAQKSEVNAVRVTGKETVITKEVVNEVEMTSRLTEEVKQTTNHQENKSSEEVVVAKEKPLDDMTESSETENGRLIEVFSDQVSVQAEVSVKRNSAVEITVEDSANMNQDTTFSEGSTPVKTEAKKTIITTEGNVENSTPVKSYGTKDQTVITGSEPQTESQNKEASNTQDVPAAVSENASEKVQNIGSEEAKAERKVDDTLANERATGALENIESSQTENKAEQAYEPILPIKNQVVKEEPVEEVVAREFEKRERSIFSLRRSEMVSGSSSKLSAHLRNTKADSDDSYEIFKQAVVTSQATEAQQLGQAEKESQNEIANNANFEKRPELMHIIQNVKADELKPKLGKESRFEIVTGSQTETRADLSSDNERMALNLTRKEGVDFMVHTSADAEYFNFDPSLTLSDEQEMMLKEYMTDAIEAKDEKKIDQSLMGYVRLGELPVANAQARRVLVANVGRVIQQEVATENETNSSSWKKHTFTMDDGNTIDLTTRSVDGVLQIKLAATNPELTRLLQNAAQDIRDHLEGELDMQFDLQFAGQEQQEADSFMGDSGSNGRNSNSQNSSLRQEDTADAQIINQTNTQSVRNFGYNQMEWTA